MLCYLFDCCYVDAFSLLDSWYIDIVPSFSKLTRNTFSFSLTIHFVTIECDTLLLRWTVKQSNFCSTFPPSSWDQTNTILVMKHVGLCLCMNVPMPMPMYENADADVWSSAFKHPHMPINDWRCRWICTIIRSLVYGGLVLFEIYVDFIRNVKNKSSNF